MYLAPKISTYRSLAVRFYVDYGITHMYHWNNELGTWVPDPLSPTKLATKAN